jgi:anti-sigma regulatory factor (Ser/Thr protein kinase)
MTTPRRHVGDSTSERGAHEETASEDGVSRDIAAKDGVPKGGAPEDGPPKDCAPGEDTASGKWRLVSRVLVPCQVRSVKAARDHVARLVVAHALDPLLADAEVVTSEIVANAIVPGSSAGLAVLLEVAVAASAVRVAVLDYSDRVPVLRELPPDDAQSGRGLHLIDSLAKSWGYHSCHPDGFTKVVWAELA